MSNKIRFRYELHIINNLRLSTKILSYSLNWNYLKT